ncbi:MAG: hypothetical protein QM811_03325 [Pirellulales bacterium]
MQSFTRRGFAALFTLVGFVCVCVASAQEATLEKARAMRQEAATADQAIQRVIDKAATPDARKDAGIAKAAVGRLGKQLDVLIAEGEAAAAAKAADIYDKGKKYPPASSVEIKPFDVPVGATAVHVPVSLDKPSVNTVIAHVRVFDGQGGRGIPTRASR